MKVETQRFIDFWFGRVICFFFDIISFFRKDKDIDTPQNILVILLSEMGSLTLTKPMFNHLEDKCHGSNIYILTFKRNIEIISLSSLVPESRIISIDDSSLFLFLYESIKAILKIRSISMDTVLDCELFSRVSSIFSFLSKASIRVGFHPYTQEGLYRGNFINRPVLYNPYLHISRQFMNLAYAIESKESPLNKNYVLNTTDLSFPKIEIEEDEQKDFIEKKNISQELLQRNLILINPGGGLLSIRAWPEEYYCEVALDFVRKGFSVGITGVEADRELSERIVASCNSEFCFDFTGVTENIRELLILFSISKLLITNDGGPSHFASLVSIPTITIFGPETPVLYGPIGEFSTNLYAGIGCSPCLTAYNHRKSPCRGENLCLKAISPGLVGKLALEKISSGK